MYTHTHTHTDKKTHRETHARIQTHTHSLLHTHTHTHTQTLFFSWPGSRFKLNHSNLINIPQTKQRNDNATPANDHPPILLPSPSVFSFRLFPPGLLVFNPVTRAIALYYFRGNWYSLSHLSDIFESCFKGQRSKLESLFCQAFDRFV